MNARSPTPMQFEERTRANTYTFLRNTLMQVNLGIHKMTWQQMENFRGFVAAWATEVSSQAEMQSKEHPLLIWYQPKRLWYMARDLGSFPILDISHQENE